MKTLSLLAMSLGILASVSASFAEPAPQNLHEPLRLAVFYI
jgi:hypothetical protein